MIEFKNSKIYQTDGSTNRISLNHDCALNNGGKEGGLCASHFWFQDINDGGNGLTFSFSTGSYTVPFRDWKRYSGYSGYVTEVCGSTPENDCTHRVWPAGYTFLVADGEDVKLAVR